MNESMAQDIVKPGLLEKIKHNLSPDSIAQRFNLTKGKLLEMGLYLIVGFVVGYLLKKYSKVVFTAAMIILVLVILHQLDLVSVTTNWSRIQDFFGLPKHEFSGTSDMLSFYWEWIKTNVGLVLSFSVGFLIGMRLG